MANLAPTPESYLRFLSFIDRRPDITLTQFSLHWRTVHRELALRLVEAGIMRGYVQNHRRDQPVAGLRPPSDGVPELWVDDADVLAKLAASPAYLQGAALDEKNFMSGSARMFLSHSFTRQGSLPRQQVAGQVKLMLFFQSSPSAEPTALLRHWMTQGLALAADAAMTRAELHLAIPNPDMPSHFSHCEAIWWRSQEEFERAWSDRTLAATGLVNAASLLGMLVDEVPVLWPET